MLSKHTSAYTLATSRTRDGAFLLIQHPNPVASNCATRPARLDSITLMAKMERVYLQHNFPIASLLVFALFLSFPCRIMCQAGPHPTKQHGPILSAPPASGLGTFQPTGAADLKAGISLTQQGHFDQAIPYLLKARGKVGPANIFALDFDLSLCYVGTRQFSKAISILLPLHSRAPGSMNVLSLLAQAYIGQKQSQLAMAALEKAAAIDPQDEKLYLFAADACSEARLYTLGLKVVGMGLRALPKSASLHYEQGMFYSSLERQQMASREFQIAMKYGRGASIGYMAEAQRALLDGNMPAVLAASRAGLKLTPDNYTLLVIQGMALVRSGATPGSPQFAEALKVTKKAVALQPAHADSQVTLGKLYLMAGQTQEAISHLEAARRLNPTDTAAYAQLAVAYRQLRNFDKARQMMSLLEHLNQQQAETYRTGPPDKHKGYVASSPLHQQ